VIVTALVERAVSKCTDACRCCELPGNALALPVYILVRSTRMCIWSSRIRPYMVLPEYALHSQQEYSCWLCSAIPFTENRERDTRFHLLQNATVKNIIDCKRRRVGRFLNRFLLHVINSLLLTAKRELLKNAYSIASAKLLLLTAKCERVTRCLQHLQNSNHVRHANRSTLRQLLQTTTSNAMMPAWRLAAEGS
jgi:hypothetical protein